MFTSSVPFVLAAIFVAASLAGQPGNRGVRQYGGATAGTGGKAPILWVNTTPRPGTPKFAFTVDNGRANAFAVGYLSAAPAGFLLGGVRVLVDFSQALPLPLVKLDGKGSARWATAIPNINSLIDQAVYLQAFVADSGSAATLGFAASRGLRVRLKRRGVLLSCSSRGQTCVDVATGRVSVFGAGKIGNSPDVAFNRSGTHCAYSDYARKIHLLDAATCPPRIVGSFNTPQTTLPWSISFAPDGIRLYVVNQGPANSNPVVQVVWAIPGSFGRPYTGKNTIARGNVIDTLRMEFTQDGKIGFLGSLGLFGGGATIQTFDTDPTSANYNKPIRQRKWGGRFLWSYAISQDDDILAAAVSGLGTNVVLNLMDPKTMKALRGFPMHPPLGRVCEAMCFGPRGHHLYIANGKQVIRMVADPKASNYTSFVTYSAGLNGTVHALACSDAGDRLFVGTDSGIYEYGVASLRLVRRLGTTRVSRLAFR